MPLPSVTPWQSAATRSSHPTQKSHTMPRHGTLPKAATLPRTIFAGGILLLMVMIAACETNRTPETDPMTGDTSGQTADDPTRDTTADATAENAGGDPSSRPAAGPGSGDNDTTHSMHNDVDSKFDAPLRRALAAGEDAPLQILIELSTPPDAAQRTALAEAGLRDVSITNRIATASGTPDAIRDASDFDFVRSLSLSQERPPLE